MLITLSVLIGLLTNLSHGAAIVPTSCAAINKTLELDDFFQIGQHALDKDSNESSYVKLPPGADIYFYTTESPNVLLGYRLRSEEEISISFVDDGVKLGDSVPMAITGVNPAAEEFATYSVLKSGILVPRPKNKIKTELTSLFKRERNKCVYQSLTPIHYIKGFQNILIPADILYSKSMQDELFPKCTGSDMRHTGNLASLLSELKEKTYSDASDKEESETWRVSEGPKTINNNNNIKEEEEEEVDDEGDGDGDGGSGGGNMEDMEAKEMYPDKTCSGEVTLFVLKNDGSFKRITADPYIPIGLQLTYSLLSDVVFHPKLLGESEHLMLSYVTGENGDLIPHSDNSFRVTAESGSSVLFMLSKNGALFPVTEERKLNKKVCYYFNGHLVHEGQQSTDVFSNSTSILINNQRIQLFGEGNAKREGRESSRKGCCNEIVRGLQGPEGRMQLRPFDNHNNRGHRLRKRREAYFNDCERAVIGHTQSQAGEPRPAGIVRGHLSQHVGEQVGHITEYHHSNPHGFRGSSFCSPNGRRNTISQSEQTSMGTIPGTGMNMGNPRYSDAIEDVVSQGHPVKADAVTAGSYDTNAKDCRGTFRSGIAFPEVVDEYHNSNNEDHQRGEDHQHPPEDGSDGTSCLTSPTLNPRTDLFIFDEKGTRIRLIPEVTISNDVVIYKLTCKGNLVRYPPCKEPEFGFEINFQLLLDEFVLVPTVATNHNTNRFQITYVLQENGDLIPTENNANTFRKSPGSLIYYMLGKNNVLFPVQQVIDMDGNVSFYYQDYFLMKMRDSVEKPLHFTTKGSPLFAFFNGLTMISMSSRPRLNAHAGSNWNQLKTTVNSRESLPKTMYLTGPKGELIKIAPYKNRQGATVVYELDCNGILYRSPKDKKKCIILKSYILLKEGILLPSNDTNGYVYMMSKNGDLFPYLYPDGKIEAPLASSLKYVLCEKGILLPIKLAIIENSLCYTFRDVVVYKERVYCKSCLDRMNEQQLIDSNKNKKSSCDVSGINDSRGTGGGGGGIKLFVNKNGENVFYEKQNKILKRRPSESVPSYLKYTMGSFEVKPDGSLHQIRYCDPSETVVNLMLEPNGDLLEDHRNVNNVRSEYYVLDAAGNLIAVEGRKTKKSIYFYRGSARVCKVPLASSREEKSNDVDVTGTETVGTTSPLGNDPLGLLEEPFSSTNGEGDSAGASGGAAAAADTRSLYIPIPLKSVSVSNAGADDASVTCGDADHKKKCEMLKDTLKQISTGNALPLALELELTDDIIEELKNWATKCDKVLGGTRDTK